MRRLRFYYLSLVCLVLGSFVNAHCLWGKAEASESRSDTVISESSAGETTDKSTQKKPILRFETSKKMEFETRLMVGFLDKMHFYQKPIHEADFKAVLLQYMKSLDYHHLFFTQKEVDTFIQRFEKPLQFYLYQGNLYPAFEIFKRYRERSLSQLNMVLERLQRPIDLHGDDSFEVDRAQSPWLSSEGEKEALWERKLTYELLNEILQLMHFVRRDQADATGDAPNQEASEDDKTSPSTQVEEAMDPDASADALESDTFRKDRKHLNDLKRMTDQELLNLSRSIDYEHELYKEAVNRVRKRYQTWRENVEEIEPEQVAELFLQVFTETAYDPNSSFLSVESLGELKVKIQSAVSGIGVLLMNEEGYCTVKEIIPGGPAAMDKRLKPQDRIVGVRQDNETDFVAVEGMKLGKIVNMIRGPKETVVHLEVIPADAVDPSVRVEIALVRDEVKVIGRIASGRFYHLEGIDAEPIKVGVIQLPAFYDSESGHDSSTHHVRELIEKMKAKGMQVLILDLRNNLGGLFLEAIRLTGLFIPEGPVLQVSNASGQSGHYIDDDGSVSWTGPLMVLINAYTASSSEIVAGALKDKRYARGLIVGEQTTHQKGSIQALYEIDSLINPNSNANDRPNYGAFKITVQQYAQVNGEPVQQKGVPSHIVFRSSNDYLPVREIDIPNSMKGQVLPPIEFEIHNRDEWNPKPVTQPLISFLDHRSQERQQDLDEFKIFHQGLDWFEQKQQKKLFSLNLSNRWQQKLEDFEFRHEMDEKLESAVTHFFRYEDVLLDAALKQRQSAWETETDKASQGSSFAPSEDSNAASSSQQTQASDAHEETLHEDAFIDIHLRESLRIARDWLYYDYAQESLVEDVHEGKSAYPDEALVFEEAA